MEKLRCLINKYNLIVIFVFTILCSMTYVFDALIFTTKTGFYYRLIIGLIISIYIFLFCSLTKPKFSKIIILFLGFYMLSSFIALIFGPIILNKNLTLRQYFLAFSTILLNCFSICYFIASSKTVHCEKITKIYFHLVMIFVVSLCIYTYIFQFDSIINSLTKTDGWNYDVTSIFYEKTAYGFFLTIGSIYTAFYSLKNKQYFYLILIIFFLLNALISRSKTTILIIAILAIFIAVILLKEAQNKSKKMFFCIVVSGLLILLALFFAIIYLPTFHKLKYFLKSSILNDGITVLNARINKWKDFLFFDKKPFFYFFGFGEKVSRYLVKANITDNIYLISMETGGLFKVVSHIILIFYAIKLTKNKASYSIRIFMIILILVSGFFEENYIFGVNFTSLAIAPIFYSLDE